MLRTELDEAITVDELIEKLSKLNRSKKIVLFESEAPGMINACYEVHEKDEYYSLG